MFMLITRLLCLMYGLILDVLGKWTLARFKKPVPAPSVQRKAQVHNLCCVLISMVSPADHPG